MNTEINTGERLTASIPDSSLKPHSKAFSSSNVSDAVNKESDNFAQQLPFSLYEDSVLYWSNKLLHYSFAFIVILLTIIGNWESNGCISIVLAFVL